ncbi:MAG: N-acetyltransferase [Gemmatimonadales bacterium]|nr:MAG: N-acetyltransferase [Gemmatimonadales bacterium]
MLAGETQGGDWVAFLWAVTGTAGFSTGATVVSIYVQPEYRGLGLARELFFEYCRRAHDQGISDVLVELPGNAMDLDQKMQEYGLSRCGIQLRMDLNRWHRGER